MPGFHSLVLISIFLLRRALKHNKKTQNCWQVTHKGGGPLAIKVVCFSMKPKPFWAITQKWNKIYLRWWLHYLKLVFLYIYTFVYNVALKESPHCTGFYMCTAMDMGWERGKIIKFLSVCQKWFPTVVSYLLNLRKSCINT